MKSLGEPWSEQEWADAMKKASENMQSFGTSLDQAHISILEYSKVFLSLENQGIVRTSIEKIVYTTGLWVKFRIFRCAIAHRWVETKYMDEWCCEWKCWKWRIWVRKFHM